jgi:hypothetical protein
MKLLALLPQSAAQTEQTYHQVKGAFEQVSDSLITKESLSVLVGSVIMALIIGRIVTIILRRVTRMLGRAADRTEDLNRVNQLRRAETLIVLTIPLARTILIIFALYVWWVYTHDNQETTALLGASALLTIILSGALFNTLRDVASGSVMMVEHWYGVGDHIQIEPFAGAQGIVERVTLRSTRIRKVNGEILWINNKDIAGVSLTPKGVHTIAIELFAKDEAIATKLINDTNMRLPQDGLSVVNPLTIMTVGKIGANLWHLTAICEVAPGREWLIEKFAIEIMKELDEKKPVLVHEPISRYADSDAERRFARTISNARKTHVQHQNAVMQKVTQRRARKNTAKS